MIEFKNVSLVRGKKEILKDVSFHLEKGTITSVIGKNGAGKTSALKCLMQEYPYKGKIFLEGNDISKMSSKERARRISCLPQILKDVPFTVYELAYLGRRPYQNRIGRSAKEDKDQIERALYLTGLYDLKDRSVDTLSGGEKQRAYLSMVLAQNTDVIALDEPSAYLDAAAEREMYSLLRKLSGEMGKTIIQIVHNLFRAVDGSDSIVILDQGRMIKQLDKDEIQNETVIEEIFSVKKGVFLSEDGERKTIYV